MFVHYKNTKSYRDRKSGDTHVRYVLFLRDNSTEKISIFNFSITISICFGLVKCTLVSAAQHIHK